LGEYTNEWSVGATYFKGTNYLAETRTMYELFCYLGDLQIDDEDGPIQIWTDHKRLVGILNKQTLTHTDYAQDYGYIIKKIVEIRENLKFRTDVQHVQRDKNLSPYFIEDSP